tara:strand:- start:842 stop:1108 length:267 start_codon:yes stop_codon:yes gene_type:complete
MKSSHKTRLLKYFEDHNSITSLEAIRDLGNTRLAATVCILRKEGYNITTSDIKVKTRWGSTTSVAKYTLKDRQKTFFERMAEGYARGL